MSNQSFIPFSSQLGIAGTSYRLQMGRVNEKWASRILKGNDIIESYIYSEEKDIPNSNLVVGWCLKVIAIPNVNPYQIMKTVQFLIKETQRNWEENKSKVVAPAAEARAARENLEAVPEDERRRHVETGWVREETAMEAGETEAGEYAAGGMESSGGKGSSSKGGRPKGRAAKAAAEGGTTSSITEEDKTRIRQRLPAIPGAGGEAVRPVAPAKIKPAAAAKAPATAAKTPAKATTTGASEGVIICKNCGHEIKFCPNCGEQI